MLIFGEKNISSIAKKSGNLLKFSHSLTLPGSQASQSTLAPPSSAGLLRQMQTLIFTSHHVPLSRWSLVLMILLDFSNIWNHKCSLIQILEHVHIHWTTALIGMFCLPGSIPALHPQRPLDPDQPALHRPHPLPGPPLMDQFRKSEKLLLTGFNSSNWRGVWWLSS